MASSRGLDHNKMDNELKSGNLGGSNNNAGNHAGSGGGGGTGNGGKSYNSGQPKVGTLVPNRIYVGGISSDTTESDLMRTFAAYGNVVSSKIIMDRSGVSKGYGFVTFQTEEEAQRLQADIGSIILKNRTLSIAPAIKKPAYAKYFGVNNYVSRPATALAGGGAAGLAGAGGLGAMSGYSQATTDPSQMAFYPYSMAYPQSYLPWMAMDEQHHNPAATAAAAAGWNEPYHGIYHY